MDRFYVNGKIENVAVISDKEEIKHITKVLRMKQGDMVEVFDSHANEYTGEIVEISKEQVSVGKLEPVKKKRELDCKITIYQGIPKGQKMELIVQKATEIGVSRIVPCEFKRCVSNISEKEDKKVSRWQKIAQEASKQSKRLIVPEIGHTMKLVDVLEDIKLNEINILFYEGEEKNTLKSYLRKIMSSQDKISSVGIIIGSEGGFEESECEELKKSGVQVLTLGDRILRTETAAIYGATILAYEFE